MGLQKAALPIPFAGGVETKQDAKQVPPVRLIDLRNGVFTKRTTISKRNGYRALAQAIEAGGGDYTDAKALAKRDLELLAFARSPASHRTAYSYRPVADRWADTGATASLVATERALVKTGTEQSQADAATNGGVTVTAWLDNLGGVWGSLVEEATGRVLTAPQALGTANSRKPRCVAVGTRLHVYWAEPALGRIDIATANPADPLAGFSIGPLIPDLTPTDPAFDACPTTHNSDNPAAIAWSKAAGLGTGWAYVHESGVIGSAATGLPAAASSATAPNNCLAIDWDPVGGGPTGGPTLWVAIGADDNAILIEIDELNLTETGQTGVLPRWTNSCDSIAVVHDALGLFAGGGAYVIAEERATNDRDRVIHVLQGSSAGLTEVSVFRGACLASRAFYETADGPHVWLTHDAPFFSVYLLLHLPTETIRSRTMPTIAHGRAEDGWLGSVTVDPDDDRRWRTPLLYNEQLEAVAGEFAETGIRWCAHDFDAQAAYQTAQLGAGLYLAGACPLHYDGDRWAEWGFHYAPDGEIVGVPAFDAAGEVPLGVFTYRIIYEEIDAAGERHMGPASIGFEVEVTTSPAKITLEIPTYRITSRRRVRISVYRSEANDTAQFFRVSSVDPTASGDNGYLLNDPTVDTVTFTDAMSDEELITQEELYTDGGAFSNDPAPMAGGALAGGKGRLFFTDPSDPHLVRYTREIAPGYAAEMVAAQALPVDPFGGAIVNLAVLDQAVIVFCEHAIHGFGGQGPGNVPSADPSANFSPSELITSDCGLRDPKSLALSPIGVVFKGTKGIQILGRDRQLRMIGTPVERYDDNVATRALVHPSEARILLLTEETDPDVGRSLLYDYEHEQWSTFTNHAGIDGVTIGTNLYYLRTDGRVFVETPGLYRDDNSQIRLGIETAWIKFAQYLQGWQRIWHAQILGEWESAHTLRVRYQLDYEVDWSRPRNLDVGNNRSTSPYGDGAYGDGPYGGAANSTRYQRRIHIGKRCQGIRFWIEDIEETADAGASYELSELLLTGGIVGPAYKLGATRSD